MMTTRQLTHHSLHFAVGFLSRPCCSIPAAAALLGAGGAGLAAAIAPYRLWLLLFAAAFFTGSFYWNFVRNRSRPGMIVWAASVALALGLFAAPLVISPRPAVAEGTIMPDTELVTTIIPIDGMSCQACVRRVAGRLEAMEGVVDVAVTLDPGRATVRHAREVVAPEEMVETIRSAGFKPGAAQ